MNKQEIRKLLGQNIKKYREQKGYSKVELARLLSIKLNESVDSSYFTHWESGRYSPTPETLKAICDILGITMSQAYGDNDDKLKDEEILLQDYRQLDLRQKQIIQAVTKTQLGLTSDLVVKTIKLFAQSACAGDGNFIDSEDYELIEVSNPPITAEFAIKIQGDSMRPLIHDGRIVFVDTKKPLQSGEIGIFCYQSNIFCKMLRERQGKIALCSLNKDYGDIVVDFPDELYIIGRVL